ncbi:MAG: FKBP-type peptidyl-prolyl cis-trans isomerase, partial [Saprospiraceae bacterium]|nr:FKBP-type peptidyl-prolyl cis-trans isomerase [Saprospiraceae bacterium]
YNIKSEAEFKKEIEGEQKVRDAERAEIIKRKADVDQITKSKLSILKKPTAEVKKTKGGVSYIIIEEGKGNKPKKGDMINVFYHGMLENGKVFDSAFERGDPLSFPVGVGKVIRGWDETLLDFPVGTKAVILIPSEQAYGETGAGDRIPPNSNLVFYVDIKK